MQNSMGVTAIKGTSRTVSVCRGREQVASSPLALLLFLMILHVAECARMYRYWLRESSQGRYNTIQLSRKWG